MMDITRAVMDKARQWLDLSQMKMKVCNANRKGVFSVGLIPCKIMHDMIACGAYLCPVGRPQRDFLENPDPDIFKNLILGFFGIS